MDWIVSVLFLGFLGSCSNFAFRYSSSRSDTNVVLLKKDLKGECELQEYQNERNGEKIRPNALREDQISGRVFVSLCLIVLFFALMGW